MSVRREVEIEASPEEVWEALATEEGRDRWLEEDPERVAAGYRSGEVDLLDVIRRHGVVLDWGTGELLPRTTEQFRAMLQRRTAAHW
jgi:N-methylhydantoinase B